MIFEYDDFFINDEVQNSNIFYNINIQTSNTVFIDIQNCLYEYEINSLIKDNLKLKYQFLFQKLFYKIKLRKYYINNKYWINLQNSF